MEPNHEHMILIVRIAAVAMYPSNTRRNCQELEMVFESMVVIIIPSTTVGQSRLIVTLSRSICNVL